MLDYPIRTLRFALQRVKLPEQVIRFVVDLFKGRKVNVLTEFGTTKEFEAGDGIKQDKTISPLIWRIFYDLLF